LLISFRERFVNVTVHFIRARSNLVQCSRTVGINNASRHEGNL